MPNKRENFPGLRRRGERSNETPIGGVEQSSRSQDNKATPRKGGERVFDNRILNGRSPPEAVELSAAPGQPMLLRSEPSQVTVPELFFALNWELSIGAIFGHYIIHQLNG